MFLYLKKVVVKCCWKGDLKLSSSTFYACNFCTKNWRQKIQSQKVSRKKAAQRLSYKKGAHKTLMKLTPVRRSISWNSVSSLVPSTPVIRSVMNWLALLSCFFSPENGNEAIFDAYDDEIRKSKICKKKNIHGVSQIQFNKSRWLFSSRIWPLLDWLSFFRQLGQ